MGDRIFSASRCLEAAEIVLDLSLIPPPATVSAENAILLFRELQIHRNPKPIHCPSKHLSI